MVIKEVVVEDSTILVLILGLTMVKLLAILILGSIMVISFGNATNPTQLPGSQSNPQAKNGSGTHSSQFQGQNFLNTRPTC